MLSYVIGDSDMITGFKLVGIAGVEVASIDEARQALNDALARRDVAIIIVSAAFSTQSSMRELIEKTRRERKTPLIVEIPGNRGVNSEIRISDIISKTVGIKI
ncbi:MAG TPA: V-type ATP synthase subunit F [Candidatus Bathyarchaeia archaeon]|nr:V-type ATP synthase subunit F [Candidatus Bathyarchaeia archaeon]